jgi:hypothetical protein
MKNVTPIRSTLDIDRAEKIARQLDREQERSRRAPDPSKLCLTPAAWSKRIIPPVDHLLGELFSTTSRAIFAADTGLGKTMFAIAVAFAIRLQAGFLHWAAGRRPPDRPPRILFIDGEMPRELMKERIAAGCAWFDLEDDLPTEGIFFLSREDVEDDDAVEEGQEPNPMPPLDTEEGQVWLDSFIESIGGVDYIIFDNFMSLCAGDLREETTWACLKPYVIALTRRRIGQLWLHHVGHDKSRPYGSKTMQWHMDVVMLGEAVDLPSA